ncbi:MAG: helix-turn-helix transcriptional regulator [Bacteroidales bacterium]|nr:helix-turn-helix transcriptional regulator [Bacteroidales bacterium]
MHGRSKLPFILAIKFGVKRFKEISKEIGGITDNMLSKELKVLEMDQLVKRTIHFTFPTTME